MSTRRPHAAPVTSALPSLDALADAARSRPRGEAPGVVLSVLASSAAFAAGAAALPRHEVHCGTTRADELIAHRSAVAEHTRRGDLRGALREIALALGLVPHATTQVEGQVPGGMAEVSSERMPQVEPLVPAEPSSHARGTPARVHPVEGGIRHVAPAPPTPPSAQRPRRPR